VWTGLVWLRIGTAGGLLQRAVTNVAMNLLVPKIVGKPLSR
jgi:hypothetical protein